MSESKESNSPKTKSKFSVRLFIAEVVIGVMVMFLWSPLAAFLGIVQPWVTILFMIGWIVFWMSPIGQKATADLRRLIYGG